VSPATYRLVVLLPLLGTWTGNSVAVGVVICHDNMPAHSPESESESFLTTFSHWATVLYLYLLQYFEFPTMMKLLKVVAYRMDFTDGATTAHEMHDSTEPMQMQRCKKKKIWTRRGARA
jgi:hypothetical protein